MLEIKLSQKSFWETKAEAYCLFLLEDQLDKCSHIKKIEEEYYTHIKEILKKHKFSGKAGQSYVVSAPKNNELIQFIFVGLGKLNSTKEENFETFRRSFATAAQLMKRLELNDAVVSIPGKNIFDVDQAELLKQLTIVGYLASYEFIKFKTEKKDSKYVGTLYLASKDGYSTELEKAVNDGIIIGRAANTTRHLADMPPNIINPVAVATHAEEMAKDFGLKCTIINPKRAAELGMGGFLAVQQGSDNEGRFVILEYTANKAAKTIALVGKGVTFDTGGISLKPSANMSGMKFDMSGAAAVIGTMQAIAQLKPDVNVVGITPLVENMPSGRASRQDDIISFMNGKTAEIRNTDAEGRLILADALCYAEKFYNPEVIIDIATLTGACVISLGLYYTGLMTKNNALATELFEVSNKCGEKLWRLPFHEDYEAAIKSDVADLSNCGKSEYGAGTITAGMFLQHFVEKTPYAHLDIAGTADGVIGINYSGRGATGVGVRLFVEFVMNYTQRHK